MHWHFSQCKLGCLLQAHRVHMSCLFSRCRPKDIKGGVCFPLCLSSRFDRRPYFRMPIWSAAVPEPLLFLPLPAPFLLMSLLKTCTGLFCLFKLVAMGKVMHNSLLGSVLLPVYRSDTPLWFLQVASFK